MAGASEKVGDEQRSNARAGGCWNESKTASPRIGDIAGHIRLQTHIETALEKSIVWIHGPPGAGKTTAIARYTADHGIEPMWFRLDPDDSDPANFFFYLELACRRVDPERAKTLPDVRPQYFQDASAFARRFFRALFSGTGALTLVLDDYQDVLAPSIVHELLTEGLTFVSEAARVIIISRSSPPLAFARLQLNGAMSVVPSDVFSLTVEEASAIAVVRNLPVKPEVLTRIVNRTNGWAAGLILMMGAESSGAEDKCAELTNVPEVIFDYFAGEIFRRLSEREQIALMCLATLPEIPAEAVVPTTRDGDAMVLMERLVRQNYFTSRDRASNPNYRFHPLFGDFLKTQARKSFGKDDLVQLSSRAAQAMEACGHVESAAALYIDIEDWAHLTRIIQMAAPALTVQGRFSTLATWLDAAPEHHVTSDAWLMYWRATVQLAASPSQSRPTFLKALELFRARGDEMGMLAAWAGRATSVLDDPYSNQTEIDHDLALASTLKLGEAPCLDLGVEFRFSLTMYLALNRRSNDRPLMGYWRDRALRAAARSGLPSLVVLMRNYIALFALVDGDFSTAREQFEVLPSIDTLKHDPLLQAIAFVAQGLARGCCQIEGSCEDIAEQALDASRESGIYLWTHLHAGMEAVAFGDAERSRKWLRRTAQLAGKVAAYHGPHYQMMASSIALLTGDTLGAIRSGELARDMTISDGWFLYEAISRVILAQAYDLIDDRVAADREMEAAAVAANRVAAGSIMLSIVFLRADFLLDRGNERDGLVALRAAMDFAESTNGRRTLLMPIRNSRLCGRALLENIKVERAKIMIRSSQLPAPNASIEAWPWPLKITALGAFAILKDGEPITLSRKTPRRLFTLLKAVIALGATNVQAEHLVDAVWPDEEGDAGHRALDTAIYRLRKLIGDPSFIVFKAGRISLDPRRVWLDVWAFEAGLNQEKAPDSLQRVLSLYKGEFLEGDEEAWVQPQRRKLASRFQSAQRARGAVATSS